MRNRMRNQLLITISLVIVCAGTVAGQQVIFANGLTVSFTSKTDPPSRDSGASGSVQIHGEAKIVHRMFVDRENHIYFGYDLEVVSVPDSNQVTLTARPLSEPPTAASAAAASGGRLQNRPLQMTDLTLRALPRYPPPQLLHIGDTLSIEVLVNQQTGVKIIDLIRVSRGGDLQVPQSVESAGRAARDLTPDLIRLELTKSQLLVNGQRVVGTAEGGGPGVSGFLVWFYLAGYGRFLLSLTPRPGYDFQKAGVVDDRRISFKMGGNRFEWISSSDIVPCAAGVLNLWVLTDPGYRPDIEEQTPYQVGALGLGADIGRFLNKY